MTDEEFDAKAAQVRALLGESQLRYTVRRYDASPGVEVGCEVGAPDVVEVASFEDLLLVPWVAFWRRSPLFVRFSRARGVMLVEYETAWYPVARFDRLEQDPGGWTGLPEWRGIAAGVDPLYPLARAPLAG